MHQLFCTFGTRLASFWQLGSSARGPVTALEAGLDTPIACDYQPACFGDDRGHAALVRRQYAIGLGGPPIQQFAMQGTGHGISHELLERGDQMRSHRLVAAAASTATLTAATLAATTLAATTLAAIILAPNTLADATSATPLVSTATTCGSIGHLSPEAFRRLDDDNSARLKLDQVDRPLAVQLV